MRIGTSWNTGALAGLGDGFNLDFNSSDFLTKLQGDLSAPSVAAPSVAAPAAAASSTWQDILGNVTKTIQTIAPVYQSVKTADALTKLNIQRAANNQPPIDVAQYNKENAATVKGIVSVDSTTIFEILGGLTVAGLVIVAVRNRSKSKSH
jgi:hypothetical protein